jgi:glucose/arabinose dehydrogenase
VWTSPTRRSLGSGGEQAPDCSLRWLIAIVLLEGEAGEDSKQIVLKDLPNGRHNTNGLALGPDGMLYVATAIQPTTASRAANPRRTPGRGR